ncbi:MAG TPA: hypothetical protein VJY34_17765 [Roseiarcus sp.]|nr:hypothetical protein [Roseiarcus sp.]
MVVLPKPDATTIAVDGVAAEFQHSGHGRAQDRRPPRGRIYLFAPLVEVASRAMRER